MKKKRLICLLTITLAVLLNLPVLTAGASPELDIDYAGDRMSVDLTNAPLSKVLEVLHKETGIDYQVNSDMEDLPISAKFSHLGLEDGLKKILARVNNAIIFGPGRKIRKVVIFNKLDKAFPDSPVVVSSRPKAGIMATPRALPPSKEKVDHGYRAIVPTPLPPPDGHGPATGPSRVVSKSPETVSEQDDVAPDGPTPITPPPDANPDGPAAAALPADMNDSRNGPGLTPLPGQVVDPEIPMPQ